MVHTMQAQNTSRDMQWQQRTDWQLYSCRLIPSQLVVAASRFQLYLPAVTRAGLQKSERLLLTEQIFKSSLFALLWRAFVLQKLAGNVSAKLDLLHMPENCLQQNGGERGERLQQRLHRLSVRLHRYEVKSNGDAKLFSAPQPYVSLQACINTRNASQALPRACTHRTQESIRRLDNLKILRSSIFVQSLQDSFKLIHHLQGSLADQRLPTTCVHATNLTVPVN